MKKILMIAAAAAFMMSGVVTTEAVAGGLTSKCKACHAYGKDKVGPDFNKVKAAYGNPCALAGVWASGFAVADRHIAGDESNASYKKFHKKAKMMSSQYKKLIKKKVEAGKFTYKELAEAVFAGGK